MTPAGPGRPFTVVQISRSTVQVGDRVNYGKRCKEYGHTDKPSRGHHNIVWDILERAGDPNPPTNHGLTPLHLAAVEGNTDSAAAILSRDPKVDPADYQFGVTPLHIAVAFQRNEILQELKKHGADYDKRDYSGWKALHYASNTGWKRMAKIVRELLKTNVQEGLSTGSSVDDIEASCDSLDCELCQPCDYQSNAWADQGSMTEEDCCLQRVPSGGKCSPAIQKCSKEEIFALFDRTKDGKISSAELQEVLEFLKIYLPRDEIEGMVRSVDANGNGVVDYEEFLQLLESPRMRVSNSLQDLRKELFNVFDLDENGYIDKREISRVMKNLGDDITEDDIEAMLKEADTDGDGRIDSSEFQKLIENLIASGNLSDAD